MHKTCAPTSVPSASKDRTLDLSLSGSQLSVSKRPSAAASPGKCLSRSVSVSVAGDRSKRKTANDAGVAGSRSIKNLRRSSSTTQVHQQANVSLSQDKSEEHVVGLFESTSDGGKRASCHRRASPDRTTWNILDDQPRSSPRSLRTREPAVALAATFTANNRSNKAAVGNSVTTILHNNYSETPLTPKSSNQKPSFNNNLLKANDDDDGAVTKYQKNFSSPLSTSHAGSVRPPQRPEVTEEEAERSDVFVQQVSGAAVTIQRWYRRRVGTRQTHRAALERIVTSQRKEWEGRTEEAGRSLERREIRKEKAVLARITAIQELQQRQIQHEPEIRLKQPGADKPTIATSDCSPESLTLKATNTESDSRGRSFRATSPDLSDLRGSQCSQELQQERLRQAGVSGCMKPPQVSPTDVKSKNTEPAVNRAVSPSASSHHRASPCSREALQRSVSMQQQQEAESSKTTLHELLDTLKLLEEEPERLKPKSDSREKYAWIDESEDSNSLTTDNLERHGQQLRSHPALPDGGALLSEAKLQSIMSFLNEMEKSEQERPRSATSGSHREVGVQRSTMMSSHSSCSNTPVRHQAALSEDEPASATAAEVTGSMMRIKLELEEKKRTVNMLQAALVQQRELTMRHVKETENELKRNLELQKEQYEATVQRHLTFIDQLISDKKALSERCEGVLGELKQVDHKYMKKMKQMQEQHEVVWHVLVPLCEEIKKLKELMCVTEKIRREKWIDEKTKKIKEITVKGLEPEIQKLISKHKQELKKLRSLHEAELLQADERATQRYVHQCEALRSQLETEKDEQCQRERALAKQRYEKQLQEEELALQQQRRRLFTEVAEEKERLAQLAARQRAELEDLRQQLEENTSVSRRALAQELDRSREEQERRHQVEVKALQERLEIQKQTWEEKHKKKEEAWLLRRECELKDELRRERDKEIELAIWTLEEETTKDKEACERAADNRVKRVRDKYEAELQELQRSEREAVEKQQELRRQQVEAEGAMISLQAQLRHRQQEVDDLTQSRDRMVSERRALADVIRQEFAERLLATEEENRRMKAEVSEVRARLRVEVERVTKEKEEELAEVHQRVKSAILKKEETVSNLRRQYEAAVKRADHLEALWEQQRKQLLEK
ncbi:centrosomal protein of 131 kDa isoform X1 [Solea solea]|uniref:centrosomal protein of 131 kDa isoform X1 n=1 Tax=Solea solea TaxID=90069 RepID=UPI00272C3F52|nr:centrosomal protein of 131 kDa isoform X1 [Solea solea]